MASGIRYRYKGKFVSAEKAQKLSNLKTTRKFLRTEKPEGERYRYKGKFVSESKAKKLSSLPQARKYVKTEYFIGTEKSLYRGFRKPVGQLVTEAIKADRKAAQEKREAFISKADATAERRTEARKKEERAKAIDIAMAASRRAEREDISIEEALDAEGFDEDDYDYFDFRDVIDFAGEFIEEGEEFFDFDMVDLEDEDKYETR